ncbi:MAG: hypothetical protein Q9157_005322 [Trypethelium eluteriae]
MPLPRNLRFPILNAHALPITTTSKRAAPALRPFSHRAPLLATGDYGSGSGDPRGENPQSQGPNPSADKEHPGPPPPKAGQGSGSTPTKGTAEGHNVSESPSAPSSSGSSSSQKPGSGSEGGKRQFSTSTRVGKDDALRSKTNQGAQPKILKDAAPAGGETSEEVRRHNEEFERRHDKAHARVTEADPEKERVGKGFWTGED